MTQVELDRAWAQVGDYWPTYQRTGSRAAVFKHIANDYPIDDVLRCLHTLALENPDARSPLFKRLEELLAATRTGHSEPALVWNAYDEGGLNSWICERWARRQETTPEDIRLYCANRGKSRVPTASERESARRNLKEILGLYSAEQERAFRDRQDMAYARLRKRFDAQRTAADHQSQHRRSLPGESPLNASSVHRSPVQMREDHSCEKVLEECHVA